MPSLASVAGRFSSVALPPRFWPPCAPPPLLHSRGFYSHGCRSHIRLTFCDGWGRIRRSPSACSRRPTPPPPRHCDRADGRRRRCCSFIALLKPRLVALDVAADIVTIVKTLLAHKVSYTSHLTLAHFGPAFFTRSLRFRRVPASRSSTIPSPPSACQPPLQRHNVAFFL